MHYLHETTCYINLKSSLKLKAWSTANAQPIKATTDYISNHLERPTDRWTDGCYQTYYLPCFAVDNKLPLNSKCWLCRDMRSAKQLRMKAETRNTICNPLYILWCPRCLWCGGSGRPCDSKSTKKYWLETPSLGIGINLIFRARNRNQLKKLESESIFLESDGIPGI